MKLKGKAYKVGDNISTDEIIPSKYLTTTDEKELGRHCLEGLYENLPKEIKPNSILVAGWNFGCGSSREHAVLSIKGCGIVCIIAKSFARIFYRNSINNGLPIIESEVASEKIRNGDIISIDLEKGRIKNITTKEIYQFPPYSKFISELINCGGLLNYVYRKQKSKKSRG